MVVAKNIKKIRVFSEKCKKNRQTVGFVPTMGALHEGHLSLVRKARAECDFLITSIFVNPLQFGPGEDFKRYPRIIRNDIKILNAEGVDLVFCPPMEEIYCPDFSVYVEEIKLSKVLCGASRPGHFRGVCTVLTKLFNIVKPDYAYFGQKDYQQAAIAKRLVRDLNFPVKIKVLPIIREKDGLAMSSRNVYLTDSERAESACLYEALSLAKKVIKEGQSSPGEVIKEIRKIILNKKSAKIDYIEIVDAGNLERIKEVKGKVLVALAVYIGKVRLIDNFILNIRQ